jgi:hypothetical protein
MNASEIRMKESTQKRQRVRARVVTHGSNFVSLEWLGCGFKMKPICSELF